MPHGKLVAFQGNLKEMSKDSALKLRESIFKHGWIAPVFVWDKNYILDGHGRLLVLQELIKEGYTIGPIPIVDIEAKTKKEAGEILLSINSKYQRMTEEGLYEFLHEMDISLDDLPYIELPDIDLEQFKAGYFDDNKGLVDPDDVPEVPLKPKTKKGDLYILGKHRVLCGDATSEADMSRLMDGKKADMVFTDPPYGINIVKSGGVLGGGPPGFSRTRQPGGKSKGIVGVKGIVKPRLYWPIIGDDKPFDPTFLLNLAPTIILFGANCYASRLPDSIGWLVWDKVIFPESNFSACELMWVNKGKHIKRYEHHWSGMVRAGGRKEELQDRVHPTQKPVGLIIQIFADYEGDLILDPFLGSGSTLIACEKTGRICFGMEIDPQYCDVIVKRWEDYTGEKAEKEKRK